MFTSSVSISSAAPITRELAWKPRCAVIIVVNSVARSTFDISTVPDTASPKLPPGVPEVGAPELGLSTQRLPATRCRPASFGNVVSDM